MKVFSYIKEMCHHYSLKEKVAHHAYEYFLRSLNHNTRISMSELTGLAYVATMLAIKIHDVDENV